VFTGLVQQLGRISSVLEVPFGRVLEVDPAGWTHHPGAGSSIAVNGCCLTIAEAPPGLEPPAVSGAFRFDVIRQTLDNTALGDLGAGDPVNLEASVTPETLLGGHIVQGHIDGVGAVRAIAAGREEHRVTIEAPPHLAAVIVPRGSITIDGVSLTIAALVPGGFEVALIPTTLEHTTLGTLVSGQRVNLESDCIARMVVHWLESRAGGLLEGHASG
jgi:riboflavin synthase